MYCQRCGALNPDDSAFCGRCGTNLAIGASYQLQPSAEGTVSFPPLPLAEQKSASLTALLNFLFGLGYVYLRYRKVLGFQTAFFVFLMIVAYFILGVFTTGIVSLALALFLAADGYLKGKGQKGFINVEQ